jgi:hypothetical protein
MDDAVARFGTRSSASPPDSHRPRSLPSMAARLSGSTASTESGRIADPPAASRLRTRYGQRLGLTTLGTFSRSEQRTENDHLTERASCKCESAPRAGDALREAGAAWPARYLRGLLSDFGCLAPAGLNRRGGYRIYSRCDRTRVTKAVGSAGHQTVVQMIRMCFLQLSTV